MQYRTCSKCGESKPETLEFFGKRGHPCRGGLRPDCRACKSAADKAWREADPEAHKARKAASRQRNIETVRAREVRYMATPEGRAARKRAMKRYVSSDKGRLAARMAQSRRRALIAQSVNDFTSDQWLAILAEFGEVCAYCGSPDQMTHDHVVPIAKGGDNTASNIVPACKPCNSSKFSDDMLSWFSRQPTYSDDRLRVIVEHMEGWQCPTTQAQTQAI